MACCVIYGGNENNMHRPPHGECKCAGAAGRPLFGLVSHRHVPPLCSWTSFNHHTSRRSNTRCHETTCLFAHLTHYCASMSVLQTCLVVPCLVLLCMGYVEHPACVSLSILSALIASLLGWLVCPHLCALQETCSCVQQRPLVQLELLWCPLAQEQQQEQQQVQVQR